MLLNETARMFYFVYLTNKLPQWVTESHEAYEQFVFERIYTVYKPRINGTFTQERLNLIKLAVFLVVRLIDEWCLWLRVPDHVSVDRVARAPPAVHRKGASRCRHDGWGRQMRSFLSQTSLGAPPSAEHFRDCPLVSTLTGVQLIGWKPPRWLWAERLVSPLVPGWLRAVRLKGPGPQWRNGECAWRERWSRSKGPRAAGTGPEYSKMGSTPRRCPGTSQFILTRWVDLLLSRTICSPPQLSLSGVTQRHRFPNVVTKWQTEKIQQNHPTETPVYLIGTDKHDGRTGSSPVGPCRTFVVAQQKSCEIGQICCLPLTFEASGGGSEGSSAAASGYGASLGREAAAVTFG